MELFKKKSPDSSATATDTVDDDAGSIPGATEKKSFLTLPPALAARLGKPGVGSVGSGSLLEDRLPSVNVISPALLDEYATTIAKRRVIFGGIGVFALVAVVWLAQVFYIGAAQNQLDAAEDDKAGYTAEITRLAPVDQLYSAVKRNQQAIDDRLAEQISYSTIYKRLRQSAPPGARMTFDSISVRMQDTGETASGQSTETGSSSPCGVTPDPFGTNPGVGCVEFAGTAKSREAVGNLLKNLETAEEFTSPYSQNTTYSDKNKVTYSAVVAVTPEIFAMSADKVTGATTPDTTVPAPSASPTPAVPPTAAP